MNPLHSVRRLGIVAVALIVFGGGCWTPPSAPPTPSTPVAPPPAVPVVQPTTTTQQPAPAPKPTTKPKATTPTTTTTTVAKTQAITISGFAFSPQILAVTTGDTVVWTNKDASPHTTVSDNALIWDSGTLSKDGSFKRVFSSPGTYTYHCGVHPSMTGTIIVRDPVKP